MEWTNGLIFEFLNLYQDEPTLWNITTPEHKNKSDAYDAWNRIKRKLSDGAIPVKEIKKKRDNLMSTYRRQRTKVRESLENGSGPGEIYKPEWPFYSIMATFLDDIYKPKKSKNYEIEIQLSTVDNKSEVPTGENEVTLPWNLLDSQQTHNSSSPDNSEPPTDLNEPKMQWNVMNSQSKLFDNSKPSKQQHKKLITRKRRLHDDNSILNTLRRFENRVVNTIQQQPTLTNPTHSKDEFYFFALSVAAQLRNLPLHIAIETQSTIQNTLSKARLSSMVSNTPSQSSYHYNSRIYDQPLHCAEVSDTNTQGVSYVNLDHSYLPIEKSEQIAPENIKQESESI